MAKPLLNRESFRDWEAATWSSGITEGEVIRQVGRRIADEIMTQTLPGQSILFLAGKGHNGDDVRAACPWVSNRRVTLIHLHAPHDQLNACVEAFSRGPDLIVEGLFGVGLNRLLEGEWSTLVTRLNACACKTISIDIPSGLDADSGVPLGVAVEADQTWTIGAPKQGMLEPNASRYVGQLSILGDVGLLGLRDSDHRLFWGEDDDFTCYPLRRRLETHKGSYGTAQIFAGSHGFHGAAVLAARGASRAMPGLVVLQTEAAVLPPVASQLQNVMVSALDFPLRWHPKTSALLAGPGLASRALPDCLKIQIAELWGKSGFALVVDASALDWIPKSRHGVSGVRVLTPHPGEAARMLGVSISDVQNQREHAIRQLSSEYGGCVVVLKGHQTMIGTAAGNVYVNPSGNPHMAQGGPGDILAGFLVGLLAQEDYLKDPIRAVRYGVWNHGRAGDACQVSGARSDINQMPDFL